MRTAIIIFFLAFATLSSADDGLTEYIYFEIYQKPNLDSMTLDIEGSVMDDTGLAGLRWDQALATLKAYFYSALSAADKAILDEIVEEYK